MGERWNLETPYCQGNLQQQIQLVSANYCSSQGWWRKVISHRLLCTEQSHQEIHLVHAKIEDIFSKLNGVKYFSTLDLQAGYHHIPLEKSSIPKTAFNSPFGKYEYVKVPFKLAQAPAYFQELMTGILRDFNYAIAYLDDTITFSRTAEEHLSLIKHVFEKLQAVKLSMKFSKSHFFTKEIQHLGHICSTKGIRPLPLKTQTIQHMHPPKTPQTGSCLPWISSILQKIHKNFCKNS